MPLQPVLWNEVTDGQRVWIDNYEGGAYPNANPRIGGPFLVKNAVTRILVREDNGRGFIHYPDNLLADPGRREESPS